MIETRQSLQQLLAGLGEAAHYESVGQVCAALPGLAVKGIGPIGVSVAPVDAKRIGSSKASLSWLQAMAMASRVERHCSSYCFPEKRTRRLI